MDFSLYSKYKPMIKIIINNEEVIKRGRFKMGLRKIKGMSSAISISKIKKRSLIIKNWILKGTRFRDKGSNPHSNGEDFSRSWKVFFEIVKFNKINKIEMKILSINNRNRGIIYIKYWIKYFNWKLNVIIFILYKLKFILVNL